MQCIFDGLKVLDFTWILVGPLTTEYLAANGATVVKVEGPTRPDSVRLSTPFKEGKPGLNRSGFFASLNANKYSIALDLNHPRGLEVAKRLVSWADVVVENFAPGVMQRWGLGYEDLKALKPDIIMLSTSNQGQTGPQSRRRGFGILLASQAGFGAITGWPDKGPNTSYLGYTDFIAARFAVAALVAALIHRRRTGCGQWLDISQLETAIHFLAPVVLDYTVNGHEPQLLGNSSVAACPHGAYPCKGEDRWCVISVSTDQEWQSFCKAIGTPAWARRPEFATLLGRKRHEDFLNHMISRWTKNFTAEEVMLKLQEAGVPAGVVQNAKDLMEDPQLKGRNYVWWLTHPEIGIFPHIGPYIRFSGTPAQPRTPAPCLGEHTEYVCREFLQMSDEEFAELAGQGVFG